MKFRASLDTVAGSILLALAVFVALAIFIGENAGARVRADLPENGEVGPYQTIQLIFSEPVDAATASALLELDPAHDGTFEQVNDTTLRFASSRPFELDTAYKLTLRPGLISPTGNEVKSAQEWRFTVREPRVAYLLTDGTSSSIWSVGLDGRNPTRLTDESIRVISFDAAQNGDFLVFTSVNEKGGIDVWRVRRDGSGASVLLDCGLDRCTTPAIAPNGWLVAYSREAAGPGPDLPFGSPRIWVLDLQNGSNNPVYEDQSILGYNPAWSPDSQKLASYDGLADRIHLLDLRENQQYIFPSNTGGPIAFSPDSNQLLFTTIEQKEDGLRTQVRLADLPLNESITLIGLNDTRDYSYYSVAWSPLENRAVLGFRAGEDAPSQILWVFDPGLLEGIIITDEPEYTYNSPRWDPWGNALVYQQFKLRGQYKPEVGLWRGETGEAMILAEGLMPRWLP
jgi:dipeptidyl aminopeptidase/acylaminoacyl peptidase